MTISIIDVGDVRRYGNHEFDPVTGDPTGFTAFQVEGVDTDPDDVSLVVLKPDGTKLAYAWPDPGDDGLVTREADGRFYKDVAHDMDGTWAVRMNGSGSAAAAAEVVVEVRRRAVPAS